MKLEDFKEIFKNKIENADDFLEIWTICDLGKDIAEKENQNTLE